MASDNTAPSSSRARKRTMPALNFRRLNGRPTWALLIALAFAVGLIAMAAVLWSRSPAFVAQTWRVQLDQAPESELEPLVDRLVALGEAGLVELADVLRSDRPWLVRSVGRALTKDMERWEALGSEAALRRASLLAEALAERWHHYGPAGRREAATILTRLLALPLPMDSRRRDALLAACAEVLSKESSQGGTELDPSSDGLSPRRPAPAAPLLSPHVVGRRTETPSLRRETSGTSDPLRLQLPDLPAGGLGMEVAPFPETSELLARVESRIQSRGVRGSTAQSPTATDVNPLRPSDSARPSDSVRPSDPLRSSAPPRSSDAPRATEQAAVHADQPQGLPEVLPPSASNVPMQLAFSAERTPGRGVAEGNAADPASFSEVRRLAAQMHTGDSQAAEAAVQSLRRMGLTDQAIQVARQLGDPNPVVRRTLARRLPDFPGLDAAPWLLQLCLDRDAEVRLEAMSLLATTQDPDLIHQVHTLAQTDPDPRIRRLSERLAASNGAPGKSLAPVTHR